MSESRKWSAHVTHKVAFHDKNSTYGRPPEGSKTEERAIKAGKHINKEIQVLVSVIRGIGKVNEDELYQVKFGKLFEYYTRISNKVVGILLRARRWNLVEFDGEMLYQGRDNNVLITLLAGPDIVPTVQHFEDYIGEEPPKEETLKDKLMKINQGAQKW